MNDLPILNKLDRIIHLLEEINTREIHRDEVAKQDIQAFVDDILKKQREYFEQRDFEKASLVVSTNKQ